MTPTTTTTFKLPKSDARLLPPAFTIIEIIVVVSIIIVLAAILIPAVGAGRRAGNKAANTAQLSSIQSGLQQYFSDFNLYPPSSPYYRPDLPGSTLAYSTITAGRGPAMLAEALMGYLPGGTSATPGSGDGAGPDPINNSASFLKDPAFGFRTRATATGATPYGKVYGPYASDNPKGFKVNTSDAANHPTDAAFIDVFGHEILYFASSQQGINGRTTTVPITTLFSTVSPTPHPINAAAITYYFDANDCTTYYPAGQTTTSPLVYADGSTLVPLPSAPSVNEPISATNKGPTQTFFKNLAGRSSNSLSSGNGQIIGTDSFLLISIGEDNNPYTDDDVLATNR